MLRNIFWTFGKFQLWFFKTINKVVTTILVFSVNSVHSLMKIVNMKLIEIRWNSYYLLCTLMNTYLTLKRKWRSYSCQEVKEEKLFKFSNLEFQLNKRFIMKKQPIESMKMRTFSITFIQIHWKLYLLQLLKIILKTILKNQLLLIEIQSNKLNLSRVFLRLSYKGFYGKAKF